MYRYSWTDQYAERSVEIDFEPDSWVVEAVVQAFYATLYPSRGEGEFTVEGLQYKDGDAAFVGTFVLGFVPQYPLRVTVEKI